MCEDSTVMRQKTIYLLRNLRKKAGVIAQFALVAECRSAPGWIKVGQVHRLRGQTLQSDERIAGDDCSIPDVHVPNACMWSKSIRLGTGSLSCRQGSGCGVRLIG